eukprot:gnl/MRDRNA2_/MRDRNA2_86904_c0_seq1.p1 gnl/MRDRNA2_/MRDRNA2_86904_c0~~gnl/MRDRNA2_/MRDRNA2_86904_c0_seq1.p1  ORF type:complete len:699 (-),score=249.03 gnl/MRDRNA2_/MRDRNA2_86904_c0_seq1:205-2154(-)
MANPIRKVVTLMQNMQKEIEEQGAKEKELFDKFMCYCSGGTGELEAAIDKASATIDESSAKLKAETAEKSQTAQELIQHKTDRETATSDLEEATMLREKEAAAFAEEKADLEKNLAAMGSAIPALEKGMGGASFVQLPEVPILKKLVESAPSMDPMDRKNVMAFLEQSGDYVPQSGQIVGILKAMEDDMKKSLEEAEADEARAVSGFGELKASKEKEVELASEAIETKTARAGELAVSVVQTADALEDAKAEKVETTKFMATLKEQCATKEKEWADRCKLRSEEVAAISQAIGILNDDDALDVFKAAIPAAFVQAPEHKNRFSFLQSRQVTIEQVKLAEKSLAGRNLALFSLKTRLRRAEHQLQHRGAVDFGAITKMIDEMLAILTQESKDDIKQKDYCVDQLDQTEAEKASTQDKVDAIASAIEELTDSAAETADELKSLQDAVASLDKDVAEATEMRKKEHEEYSETLKLGEIAVELIGKAKNRLQKFYNPALYKAPPKKEMTMEEKIIASGSSALMQSEANFDAPDDSDFHGASLLQVAPPEMPEAPGAHKKSAKSGGVMALMDMIVGELKMSNQEASMSEKYAQKEYVELMADSQDQRGQYSKSIVEKTKMKADLEGQLTEAKQNQALTLQALQNVHDTLGQLRQ